MHHPRLENIVLIIGLLWPLALIAYKLKFPATRWLILWITVPVMSWICVNAALQLDPPMGAKGSFAMIVNLELGWIYLIPLFGILQIAFMLFQLIIRHYNKPT